MHVFTVSFREDTYHLQLAAIFKDEDDAETYASRVRTLIDGEVVVEPWAVNECLPEWDGEE